MSSSKRHILSFVLTMAVLGFLVSIPFLIERIEFFIFQHYQSNYVLEDYKYISESLTEVELMQLSKQFIPSNAKEETSGTATETKTRKVFTKKELAPLVINDNFSDDNAIKDLMEKDSTLNQEEEKKEKKESDLDDGLYMVIDVMPSFPGGEPGLMDFVYKNLRYPPQAIKDKVENCVICTFIIDKNGSVTDPEVTQSANPLLNKEALRIISTFPKWRPARKNGRPVRVKYTLPIIFRLK